MFEIDKQKFGAFIAELRKEKGFTQKELAEKLFISDKAVSKWETGQSMPDITLLRPLADILEVTTTELLEGKRLAPDSTLDAKRVDDLVQTVITYSEEEKTVIRRKRGKAILWYVICMAIGITEMIIFFRITGIPAWVRTGPSSWNLSNILTMEILCGIFGLYFCAFAKEKLPYYYDNDKISAYSHGIFKMNMPGVYFNNHNWPYIVRAAQLWCLITAVVYPLIAFIVFRYAAELQGIFSMVALVIVLSGLFVPMYVVAKKYE